MKTFRNVALVIMAIFLLGGCCSNPGVFSEIQKYKSLVQSTYYTVDGVFALPGDEYVAMGGLAADTALALAGSLQTMSCPSQQAVNQLAAQVKALPLVLQ